MGQITIGQHLDAIEAELRRRGGWQTTRSLRTLSFASYLQWVVLPCVRGRFARTSIVRPMRDASRIAKAVPSAGELDHLIEACNERSEGDLTQVTSIGEVAVDLPEAMEAELRRLGWWTEHPLDANDDVRYLSPDRYLQFVILPKLRAGTSPAEISTALEGICHELSDLPTAAPLRARLLAAAEMSEPIRSPSVRLAALDLPADVVTSWFDRHYEGLRPVVTLAGYKRGHVPLAMLRIAYASHVAEKVASEIERTVGGLGDVVCAADDVREGSGYRLFANLYDGTSITSIPKPFQLTLL